MLMHRFYLPPDRCRDDWLTLSGSEAYHASRVLRVRTGERVTVLDGAGETRTCDIVEVGKKSITLKVVDRTIVPPLSCAITLLQAIPKGKIIESIIQKAAELGAARIVPIISERIVSQIGSDSAETKARKWQQIAIEAIKQCGSAWLPKVDAPLTLKSFLERRENFEISLVGSLEPGSRHPREHFDSFFSAKMRSPASVAVWIGPEGDFTASEYGAIRDSGARPITLGPLVLRVETAATYCLSVINYELQASRR